MTVPSQFIIEMPREEMDCGEIAPAKVEWDQSKSCELDGEN
jgi:hypothetical protein